MRRPVPRPVYDEPQPRRCEGAEMAWLAHVVGHYFATAFGSVEDGQDAARIRQLVLGELHAYGVSEPESFLAALGDRR
jgi:hypothetical protein